MTVQLVNPLAGVVTSKYDPKRVHPVLGRVVPHYGTDIGGRPRGGTHRIGAAAAGRVIYVRTDSYAGDSRGGYLARLTGRQAVVDHGVNDGRRVLTYYGHLLNVFVKAGQDVEAGQPLGTQGATGLVDGAHLHLEVWVDGFTVDPEKFFRDRGILLGAGPTTPPQKDEDMPLSNADVERVAKRAAELVWATRVNPKARRTAGQIIDRTNHAAGRTEKAYRQILAALKIKP